MQYSLITAWVKMSIFSSVYVFWSKPEEDLQVMNGEIIG